MKKLLFDYQKNFNFIVVLLQATVSFKIPCDLEIKIALVTF